VSGRDILVRAISGETLDHSHPHPDVDAAGKARPRTLPLASAGYLGKTLTKKQLPVVPRLGVWIRSEIS
jgi:hypothetical protein